MAMENAVDAMVPIAGIGMIIAIVWIGSYFRNRERDRLHETLRMMVEKGQPISGDLLESLNTRPGRLRGPPNDLRRGVVLMAIAFSLAGLGLALGVTGEGDAVGPLCGAAAFPGFIGLGYVVLGLINRDKAKD